jgi:bacterioferritin
MLAIGVAPNASQLRSVKLAADLFALLQINQQLEADIIQLYHSATQHCARVGDHDSRMFFEELLKEEQQHHAELETWLNRLQQVPKQPFRGGR